MHRSAGLLRLLWYRLRGCTAWRPSTSTCGRPLNGSPQVNLASATPCAAAATHPVCAVVHQTLSHSEACSCRTPCCAAATYDHAATPLPVSLGCGEMTGHSKRQRRSPTSCQRGGLHCGLTSNSANRMLYAGPELERMARSVGFETARQFELAGGLMGCLVATTSDA